MKGLYFMPIKDRTFIAKEWSMINDSYYKLSISSKKLF